jgi:hypothetical protein
VKILLDECIDRRLARELIGHVVTTVPQRGWAGIKNGQLLALAQTEFDVFVTVDRKLPKQQELAQFSIAVVLLEPPTNTIADLRLLIPQLLASVSAATPGTLTAVRAAAL